MNDPAANADSGGTRASFRYVHRVTYAECTVGNHIYHSRYLDLLEAAGCRHLSVLSPCTMCDEERFFSFRRDGAGIGQELALTGNSALNQPAKDDTDKPQGI